MQIKKMLNSRLVTVAACATVVALIGAGAGYSASTITSKDIKDNTIKIKDIKPGTVDKLKGHTGPTGPQGPQGPSGGSNVSQVKNLNGQWTARATDVAGLKMTGDGIQFGPFASPGACAADGVDYARLDFSGLNGQPLSSLKNLVFRGRFLSDTDTSGAGSPAIRVFFSGTGTGGDGVPNEPNRFTFSPNTQFNNPLDYQITQGETHEYVVTSGSVRYNDDPGNTPSGEKAWSVWASQFPSATISNINILGGCSAGTNLSILMREAQVNGQHYEFGS
jgi:hypothetical protein